MDGTTEYRAHTGMIERHLTALTTGSPTDDAAEAAAALATQLQTQHVSRPGSGSTGPSVADPWETISW